MLFGCMFQIQLKRIMSEKMFCDPTQCQMLTNHSKTILAGWQEWCLTLTIPSRPLPVAASDFWGPILGLHNHLAGCNASLNLFKDGTYSPPWGHFGCSETLILFQGASYSPPRKLMTRAYKAQPEVSDASPSSGRPWGLGVRSTEYRKQFCLIKPIS